MGVFRFPKEKGTRPRRLNSPIKKVSNQSSQISSGEAVLGELNVCKSKCKDLEKKMWVHPSTPLCVHVCTCVGAAHGAVFVCVHLWVHVFHVCLFYLEVVWVHVGSVYTCTCTVYSCTGYTSVYPKKNIVFIYVHDYLGQVVFRRRAWHTLRTVCAWQDQDHGAAGPLSECQRRWVHCTLYSGTCTCIFIFMLTCLPSQNQIEKCLNNEYGKKEQIARPIRPRIYSFPYLIFSCA